MKRNFYALLFLATLTLCNACSKDFLKKYDKRIIGTWRIANINRIGLSGDSNDLPFKEGSSITFGEDGNLTYVTADGRSYQGRWDISKKWLDDKQYRGLEISAASFGTQEVLSEYYDDMTFVGTDHFKATVITGFKTYVTHFRR